MVTAIEYRAMALQHHRWAGMCRSPESREEHFRLEKELLALADSEDRLHGVCAPEQPSSPQQS
jgi:thymidine kinase